MLITLNSGRQIAEKLLKITAAAAAKSLQSCPVLCNPRDGSPPGFPVPAILQARILEWVAIPDMDSKGKKKKSLERRAS